MERGPEMDAQVADAIGVDRAAPAGTDPRFRLAAQPYSTDWNAAMTLRAWVMRGGPMREARFAHAAWSLLRAGAGTMQGADFAAAREGMAQVPLGRPATWAPRAWLVLTPVDLCYAVLITAEEERGMAAEESGA